MEPNIKELFDKYAAGKATSQEILALYDHFGLEQGSTELGKLIDEYIVSENTTENDDELQVADRVVHAAWQNIHTGMGSPAIAKKKKLPFKWLAAAAALLIFGITMVYFMQTKKTIEPQLTSIYGNDVMPGTNKATLTLSNGHRYELKDLKEGLQINESGISYYDGEAIAATDQVINASIHVPNGGTYKVNLPDGTKVQLNAGTDFSYPIRFDGKERLVQLSGEGYFEVSPDAAKPFKVLSGDQVVTVHGTHFNVQAHKNEPIETTLLEGSVSVSSSTNIDNKAMLVPGQQASYLSGRIKVRKVPAEDYIGWTKNLFIFNHLSLPQIFTHLERWYDVEIIYPSNLSMETYLMEIPKDRKLSEILEPISDLTGVSFTIQGRRITVKQR